ncbi:MAG: hypothetical protein ACYC35_00250 [Pirellulales bacterium]
MTYVQAIKPPKRGYANANDETMLATLAESLGRHCCLRPEAVFNWAKRHSSYRDLLMQAGRLIKQAAGMELLDAVLNDHPLEARP